MKILYLSFLCLIFYSLTGLRVLDTVFVETDFDFSTVTWTFSPKKKIITLPTVSATPVLHWP